MSDVTVKRFVTLKLAMGAAPVWTVAGYATEIEEERDESGILTGFYLLKIWRDDA